jgi:hypothetical protein
MRRGSLWPLLGLAVATACLTLAATADAQDSRQSAKVEFTTTRPASSSGLTIDIDYVNPEDPQGKPPAVRRIVVVLARGSSVDTGVPPQCAASDAELMLLGGSACPGGSRVGGGFVRLDTGIPGPLRFLDQDLTLFNNQDQVIFLFTNRRTGARLASRATVEGRRLVSTAPPLPGAPPDGGAVDVVRERIDAVSDGARRYISTPRCCPIRGFWRNRISFTYADGVSQTVVTRAPCRPAHR